MEGFSVLSDIDMQCFCGGNISLGGRWIFFISDIYGNHRDRLFSMLQKIKIHFTCMMC